MTYVFITRKQKIDFAYIRSQYLGGWQTKIAIFFIQVSVRAPPSERSGPDIATFYASGTKNAGQRAVAHPEAE
jgi:hypothetical protein